MCPSPYFVEYGFYASNYGGKLVPVQTKLPSFSLDIEAMERAITPKTRAVIVNSPNNPTGQIYSREELAALAAVLKRHSEKNGRVIYLISDEPYRFLNFDQAEIPSVFELYDASVVIGSFSKSLSLAGERIGYVAVSPTLEGGEELVGGLILTNRILGFVNAPAIAQKILQKCINSEVDMSVYSRRRDAMAKVLRDAGIEFSLPRGAFYFFPKSPTTDETVFIAELLKEHVLAVPGRGFGLPGYLRLALCVDETTIANSADAFKRAVAAVR
jgi:aspartate aminotransferase